MGKWVIQWSFLTGSILSLCRTSDLNPSPEPCAFSWRQGLFPSLPGSLPPINSLGLSSRLLSSAEQEPWVVILQDMCSTFQALRDQKRRRDKGGHFALPFTAHHTRIQGRNLEVGALLTDLFSLLPFTTQDCQARDGITYNCLCFLTSIIN